MTNDTTTLNGALQELGEVMASNLTTQNVPSTWDEGLTTLASKILNITGGGGGGLEYETGTYVPTASEQPTIYFANAHSTAPSIIIFEDVSTETATISETDAFIYVNSLALFGAPLLVKASTFYNEYVAHIKKHQNNNVTSGLNEYTRGEITSTSFRPYAATNYNYPTGHTLKWIAIWSPTQPPTPSFDGISLTGDKNILSAADSEYVTLTAQLLDGQSSAAVSGETVSFKVYKVSDDTLIDTLTDDTDSTGVATVSYYGQGTGDLYIKSSVDSIISSEIYVEDCTYYSTTQYTTSSVTLNIDLPSAPFSLEYVLKQTNSNASVPYIDIGASSNNRMLVGQYARAGTNGLITYTGSQTNYPYGTNPTLNQENIIHFTYDGSDYTYWLNDLSPMTVSDKGITLSKIIHSESGSGGYIKNIKVKPL